MSPCLVIGSARADRVKSRYLGPGVPDSEVRRITAEDRRPVRGSEGCSIEEERGASLAHATLGRMGTNPEHVGGDEVLVVEKFCE